MKPSSLSRLKNRAQKQKGMKKMIILQTKMDEGSLSTIKNY